ncbi:MAG: asparagine synthase (glutamine-hydrolyzing) [Vicinamibacterales bacterium]
MQRRETGGERGLGVTRGDDDAHPGPRFIDHRQGRVDVTTRLAARGGRTATTIDDQMCGIAGVWQFDGAPVSKDGLARMTTALRHRGPDDAGVWTDGPIGLGHRRLSIIDTSQAAHQPIANEDGSIHLTYNGEIYNFAPLRDELAAKGHRFQSRTDSEVIVHAYEEWGTAAVERFNGMFAFALWDARRHRLWLVRDRLGVKPLFYYDDGRRFVFGSEIKAILECPGVDRELDHGALAAYFELNHVPAPSTPFRRVRVLPPGHALLLNASGASPAPYWDVRFDADDPPRPLRDYVADVTALVETSVAERRVSDVPLGAFLSGGIDSSAIVHVLRKHVTGPLETFSVRFDDASHDEGRFARLAAEREGTTHHEVVCRPTDLSELLDRIMWHADNLTADISMVPMYVLARLARSRVTVVLSGDGGDEVFGGYPTYQADRAAALYRRLPAPVRATLGRLARQLPATGRKMSLDYVVNKFLAGAALPVPTAHASWRSIFSADECEALLTPDARRRRSARGDSFGEYYARSTGTSMERLFYGDLKTFLPDSILPKVDTMTMAHGLEAREPLLDYRLVELGARIPERYKIRGRETKWIFKRAMADRLPDAIVRRAKAGFQPPMAAWFRGPLRPFVRDVLTDDAVRTTDILDPAAVVELEREHADGRRNHAFKLWSLMSFVSWHRQWARAGAGVA